MLIQLKQTEIITALKQYITLQGIDLSGKSVNITFTAGRKESGISADLDIEEENDFPNFSENDPTTLTPVTTSTKVEEVAKSEDKDPVSEPEPEIVEKVKSASLFS